MVDKFYTKYNVVFLAEITEFAYGQGQYMVYRAKVLRETKFKPFNDRCYMLSKKAHLNYVLLDVNPRLGVTPEIGDTVLIYK